MRWLWGCFDICRRHYSSVALLSGSDLIYCLSYWWYCVRSHMDSLRSCGSVEATCLFGLQPANTAPRFHCLIHLYPTTHPPIPHASNTYSTGPSKVASATSQKKQYVVLHSFFDGEGGSDSGKSQYFVQIDLAQSAKCSIVSPRLGFGVRRRPSQRGVTYTKIVVRFCHDEVLRTLCNLRKPDSRFCFPVIELAGCFPKAVCQVCTRGLSDKVVLRCLSDHSSSQLGI